MTETGVGQLQDLARQLRIRKSRSVALARLAEERDPM